MPTYKELIQQRAELEKEIETARRQEARAAIVTVRDLIFEYSLTAAECGFDDGQDKPKVKPKMVLQAKYRGPNGETWSGRGKAPNWLTAQERIGHIRSDFLIQNA